jgi:hypothetical protein
MLSEHISAFHDRIITPHQQNTQRNLHQTQKQQAVTSRSKKCKRLQKMLSKSRRLYTLGNSPSSLSTMQMASIAADQESSDGGA